MKFIKSILQRFQSLREQYHAAKEMKRKRFLANLSCDDINVIEFNGRVYLSHKGAPIVRIDDLKGKAPDILAQSREDYLAWKEKFNV